MFAYLSAGMGLALAASVMFNFAQAEKLRTRNSELALERHQLSQCGARLENLIEDVRSDNAIDNLPVDALRNVPDRWLRPEDQDAAGGG